MLGENLYWVEVSYAKVGFERNSSRVRGRISEYTIYKNERKLSPLFIETKMILIGIV